MTPPFKTDELFSSSAIAHGFFGRQGGVSTGQYSSLNAGHGSDDKAENVAKNRQRVATALGAKQLLSLHQIHSREVAVIDAPFTAPPKADGMVTRRAGIALSALSADCGPAVLGPCISQPNYEVGESFRDTFIGEREIYDRFFRLGPQKDSGPRQPHFDLKAFILHRLRDAGLTRIAALPDCTYALPGDYVSYRYNTHKGIADYGRNISAIMLRGPL